MGSLFGSITVKGNRLTDLVGQTSAVGRPIPFGYGYCQIDEPNVIWTAGIPKEHVKKKKQGKGGVKTEEYTYTLSYAIAFMAGPVYGFLTIKRGGKVVYTTDPNATIDDKAFAAKWRQKARFYYGTRTQMPDATIESYVGAGRVSAFRDLCYIVVVDDDVTSEGGAVPQYEAVIIASPPDVYVTSKPYYQFDDSQMETYLSSESLVLRQVAHTVYADDTVDTIASGQGLVLKDSFNKTYMDEFTTPYMTAASMQVKKLQVSTSASDSTSPSMIGYALSLKRVNILAYTQMDSVTPYMAPQGLTLT